ncbi:MAG: HAD-IA family hydrolase [Terriglobales bacterium]|jgi:glucose-1-phosphatase
MNTAISVVLFDVGGVLVEPSGVATMLTWMDNRVSTEELWQMWLTSPTVRSFETGKMSTEDFADRIIADFSLPILGSEFLREMTRWSVTLFPGAIELIERVPSRYQRATLCNSNPIHWSYLTQNERLINAFEHHFASHLIGKIKPDEEAFRYVTDALGCEPEEVLFLDDNHLNVLGASTSKGDPRSGACLGGLWCHHGMTARSATGVTSR